MKIQTPRRIWSLDTPLKRHRKWGHKILLLLPAVNRSFLMALLWCSSLIRVHCTLQLWPSNEDPLGVWSGFEKTLFWYFNTRASWLVILCAQALLLVRLLLCFDLVCLSVMMSAVAGVHKAEDRPKGGALLIELLYRRLYSFSGFHEFVNGLWTDVTKRRTD